MKLIIDRSKWLRGTGDGTLLDHEGKMCCLGFFARACGYNDDQIVAHADPTQMMSETALYSGKSKFPQWLTRYDQDQMKWLSQTPESALVSTNDKEFHLQDHVAHGSFVTVEQEAEMKATFERDREKKIAKLFREHGGVEVVFIDSADDLPSEELGGES